MIKILYYVQYKLSIVFVISCIVNIEYRPQSKFPDGKDSETYDKQTNKTTGMSIS